MVMGFDGSAPILQLAAGKHPATDMANRHISHDSLYLVRCPAQLYLGDCEYRVFRFYGQGAAKE